MSFPPDAPRHMALWDLASRSGYHIFQELNRMLPASATRQNLGAWIQQFSTLLTRAGWTGGGTESIQYQAWCKISAVMARIVASPTANYPCAAGEALSTLQNVLSAQLFAPQTQSSPVQVMGYMETTGLRFTHLWVAGMSDTAWPATAAANPLIPMSLQRAAGIPRIDQPSEMLFAQRRMAHWLGSSINLVFSHAADADGTAAAPSSLTRELPSVPVAAVVANWHARSHPMLAARDGMCEPRTDTHGTPLPPGPYAGGSGLLKDQAECPFKGWAVHRLGIRRPREPRDFPDAADRGNLLHDALFRLLKGSERPRHPADVSEGDLEEAIDEAMASLYRRFPAPFLERERQQLLGLLSGWLSYEQQRGPFTVVSLESEAHIQVAGLSLKLRMDRVDQVGGGLAIIDYKTGAIRPAGLLDARLLEPQLPAYAISIEGVRAALMARVTASPRLVGVADPDVDLAPARIQGGTDEGWEALQTRWRGQLENLAAEFKRGRAEIDPANPAVCDRCHLQPFCRIGRRWQT